MIVRIRDQDRDWCWMEVAQERSCQKLVDLIMFFFIALKYNFTSFSWKVLWPHPLFVCVVYDHLWSVSRPQSLSQKEKSIRNKKCFLLIILKKKGIINHMYRAVTGDRQNISHPPLVGTKLLTVHSAWQLAWKNSLGCWLHSCVRFKRQISDSAGPAQELLLL